MNMNELYIIKKTCLDKVDVFIFLCFLRQRQTVGGSISNKRGLLFKANLEFAPCKEMYSLKMSLTILNYSSTGILLTGVSWLPFLKCNMRLKCRVAVFSKKYPKPDIKKQRGL